MTRQEYRRAAVRARLQLIHGSGPDADYLSPLELTAAAALVEIAHSQDVKVIAYDRLIRDSGNVDYYATFDNFKVGVQQATSLVNGMTGFFNPTGTISRQFKTGMMGEGVLGFDEMNMSQSIVNHTTGSRAGTILVNETVATQGQATITLDGLTSSTTVTAGDVFTIAGVYAVNPQTRLSTGSLQQFVVTADVTVSSTTTATLSIQPPIYTSTNALATVDSFPAASAVLTFLGGSATAYPQNLIYHKDAITLATADLLLPQGVDMASRQVHNGISLRIVRQYDINNDRMPCRVDVLYGFCLLYTSDAADE